MQSFGYAVGIPMPGVEDVDVDVEEEPIFHERRDAEEWLEHRRRGQRAAYADAVVVRIWLERM